MLWNLLLQQSPDFLNGEIEGNPDIKVNTIAKIEEGQSGALSFLANPKYEHYLYDTKSSIVLVNKSFVPSAMVSATLIRVENAYEAFASLLRLVDQSRPRKKEFILPQLLKQRQKSDPMFLSGHMPILVKIVL